MLKLILWSLFTICLFSWLEEIAGHIRSIDKKLTAPANLQINN